MPKRVIKSLLMKEESFLGKYRKKQAEAGRMKVAIAEFEELIRSRMEKLKDIQVELVQASSEFNQIEEGVEKKHCLKVTTRLKTLRKRNTTQAELEWHDTNLTQVNKRRKQTWACAQVIHGGTTDNPEPTLCGLFDLLSAKEKSVGLTTRILSGKSSVVNPLKKPICRSWSAS